VGQTAARIPKSFTLEFTVLIKQELDEFTALCLDYDIASCGPSADEAFESLLGLVDMYVNDCLRQGEIPIPTRKVSYDIIEEFLCPPQAGKEVVFQSRRAIYPVHATT
jgi:hypothetical protein